jgi:hypothetical protein
MSQKIVINTRYGGFSISDQAIDYIASITGRKPSRFEPLRDDPALVEAVTVLGEAANGVFAALQVVEIPDDVEWQIEEYDGLEWVAEKHQTWGAVSEDEEPDDEEPDDA